ncbi:sporulation protein [Alteromonas sp. a30]|uniref:sporulation protein n=1 Tax=Alteromonas sp. a30 TaxID=2730917 RepID=UPI00228223C4|nr:sporulation protein [Alteromonas sp. a30]MCY7295577.1 sporulation protein [Alteromonas sp. a30]
MFKKLLASVGIGNANVDLIILSHHLIPGENFDVEIRFKGGNVAQEINGITLALMTQAKYEEEDAEGEEYSAYKNLILQQWDIEWAGTVEPHQEYAERFELDLHPETPLTTIGDKLNQSRVWIETGLDIQSGLDASDRDFLDVSPLPVQYALLAAMESLGYYLKKVDVELGQLRYSGANSSLNCYQEIEFGLRGSGLFGIKEVEVTFINDGHETEVVLEIDRTFGSDTYRMLVLDNHLTDINEITRKLQSALA